MIGGQPYPADFPAFAAGRSNIALARHYSVDPKVVRRWIREANVTERPFETRPRRAAPDGFIDVAHLPIRVLSDRYGCSGDMISRWRSEVGASLTRKRFDIPHDFADMALVKWKVKLASHYGVCIEVIRRWCLVSGVEPIPAPMVSIGQKNAAQPRSHTPKTPYQPVEKPRSIHDVAARTLREERWTVFRCDERGRGNPDGHMWRVGNVVCDGDELLSRAAKYARAAA